MSSKLKLLLASGGGFFAGLCYHKNIIQQSNVKSGDNDYQVVKKPGLPMFGK